VHTDKAARPSPGGLLRLALHLHGRRGTTTWGWLHEANLGDERESTDGAHRGRHGLHEWKRGRALAAQTLPCAEAELVWDLDPTRAAWEATLNEHALLLNDANGECLPVQGTAALILAAQTLARLLATDEARDVIKVA